MTTTYRYALPPSSHTLSSPQQPPTPQQGPTTTATTTTTTTTTSSSSSSPPTTIPPTVYRVHRTSAKTRYTMHEGFASKNQTTILNYTSALSRFGLAHLNHQTNISSPFISVYSDRGHAEAVARHFAATYREDTYVVAIDTRHFARGPVFRAADLLKGAAEDVGGGTRMSREKEWLHWGEYLVMYKIPALAIREETPVARGAGAMWRAPGVVAGGV